MERFISGAGVRERFQWLPFELVAAMKTGELIPINPEGDELVRFTEDVNPCLYCNGKRNPNECGRGKVTCTSFSLGSGQIMSQSRSCLRHYTKTSQTQELDAATFFFSEVLDYEKAHGLKPATTPPTATTEPDHDQQQVEEKEPTTITLPTMPETAWDQIRIRIAKNDRFEIDRPGYKMEFFNAQELGLQKARTKLALLKTFGLNDGELQKNISKEASPANISNLRKHISGIFPEVKGDPIPISEGGRYVCKLQIFVNKEEFSREHYTSDDITDKGNDWEEIMGARR